MSGKGDSNRRGKGQGDEDEGRSDPGSEAEIEQGWGQWSSTGLQPIPQTRREGKGTKGGPMTDPWQTMTAGPELADAGEGRWGNSSEWNSWASAQASEPWGTQPRTGAWGSSASWIAPVPAWNAPGGAGWESRGGVTGLTEDQLQVFGCLLRAMAGNQGMNATRQPEPGRQQEWEGQSTGWTAARNES